MTWSAREAKVTAIINGNPNFRLKSDFLGLLYLQVISVLFVVFSLKWKPEHISLVFYSLLWLSITMAWIFCSSSVSELLDPLGQIFLCQVSEWQAEISCPGKIPLAVTWASSAFPRRALSAFPQVEEQCKQKKDCPAAFILQDVWSTPSLASITSSSWSLFKCDTKFLHMHKLGKVV